MIDLRRKRSGGGHGRLPPKSPLLLLKQPPLERMDPHNEDDQREALVYYGELQDRLNQIRTRFDNGFCVVNPNLERAVCGGCRSNGPGHAPEEIEYERSRLNEKLIELETFLHQCRHG